MDQPHNIGPVRVVPCRWRCSCGSEPQTFETIRWSAGAFGGHVEDDTAKGAALACLRKVERRVADALAEIEGAPDGC